MTEKSDGELYILVGSLGDNYPIENLGSDQVSFVSKKVALEIPLNNVKACAIISQKNKKKFAKKFKDKIGKIQNPEFDIQIS